MVDGVPMKIATTSTQTPSLAEPAIRRVVEDLRRRLEGLRPIPVTAGPRLRTGIREIDEKLLGGGIPSGSLVEWLAERPGSGAEETALRLATAACRDGGAVVIVDHAGTFYPPAAFRWGLPPARTILVRPASQRDAVWAVHQCLADESVAVVLAAFPRLDDVAPRRFQLAVEKGGGLGLILRPAAAKAGPCWAAVRLLVEPLPWPRRGDTLSEARRLRIHLLAARGMIPGRSVEILVHEPTYPLSGDRRLAERFNADAAPSPLRTKVRG
ncbi:MAG: ImuA family protein [Thermogutta sp.]